jgi:hypothetical protein
VSAIGRVLAVASFMTLGRAIVSTVWIFQSTTRTAVLRKIKPNRFKRADMREPYLERRRLRTVAVSKPNQSALNPVGIAKSGKALLEELEAAGVGSIT